MSIDSINDNAGRTPNEALPQALVVEDQDELRTVLSAMIEGIGFEVTQASNADVAQALLIAGGRFDLLLTDVNMPGSLDGAGLAKVARQLDANMTIIVATGRQENLRIQLPLDVPVLSKPFRMHELLSLVKRTRQRRDEQGSDVVT